MRTVEAGGGSVLHARGLYVARRPPTTRHFFSQRVRQAYDDFARPPRLAAALATAPLLGLALRRRAWRTIGSVAAATVVLAEIGRRREGGRTVFPPVTAWCAPVWVLERGLTSWAAVGWRLTGGCRYAGTRLRLAAHSRRTLRHRLASAGTA
jgi:hypothetical protein